MEPNNENKDDILPRSERFANASELENQLLASDVKQMQETWRRYIEYQREKTLERMPGGRRHSL